MLKSLMPVAAGLAGLAMVTFVVGTLMLGVGIALPSKGGGFGSMLSGGSGPERAGYEDGHPVGLYLMTRYWIATGSLEKAVYYFTSDGRVFVNLEDGFSDDVLAQHQGEQGTVRAEGSDMVITWRDGNEQRNELEKGKNGFSWDMGIFAPVESFDDDKELVGRWEGGSSVTFSGSWGATSRTLDLRPDGTFTGESVASMKSTGDGSVASAGSQSDLSGNWSLDGYVLVLTYNDGRVSRGITFPFDDEETPVFPDRFYFGSTLYKKLS